MVQRLISETRGSSLVEKLLLLVIFIVPLWPRHAMISVQGLPNINLTRIAIFSLVTIWILTVLGFKQYRHRFRVLISKHNKIVLVVLILFIWRFLSVINVYKIKSVYVLLDELFTWYLLAAISTVTMSSSAKINKALRAMIFTCLVITIIGAIEAFVGHNLFLDVYQASTEDIDKALSGTYRERYRIMATFSNTLSLAEYLAFMLPILLFGYVHGGTAKIRCLSLCTALLSVITISLAGSRGAWVILIIMGLSFLLLYYQRKLKTQPKRVGYFILSTVVPILLILLFVGVFIINEFVKGRTFEESQSSYYRLKQLEIGIPLVLERPLFGYGLGEAATVVGMISRSVDNYYLTISLESGLPTLFMLLFVLAWVVKRGYGIFMARRDESGNLAGVLAISIFGFSIFLSVLSLKEIFPIVFLTFSMLLGLKDADSSSQEREKATVHRGQS